jgi:hypothetical protein
MRVYDDLPAGGFCWIVEESLIRILPSTVDDCGRGVSKGSFEASEKALDRNLAEKRESSSSSENRLWSEYDGGRGLVKSMGATLSNRRNCLWFGLKS